MISTIITYFLSPIGRSIAFALGILALITWFSHWSSERGRKECELRIHIESQRVRLLVEKEFQKVVRDATTNALDMEKLNDELQAKIDEVIKTSEKSPTKNVLCVPSAIVDGLRNLK